MEHMNTQTHPQKKKLKKQVGSLLVNSILSVSMRTITTKASL